jgi:hypothetical protein
VRDPRCFCESGPEKYLLSRDWLQINQFKENYKNYIYIDVGASTWNTGAGGSSQNWVYENYKLQNISFDRFILWEMKLHLTSQIFNPLPKDQNLLKAYQYFNIPANVDPQHAHNPVSMAKLLHKEMPNSYIVFKLDMDHPSEIKFIPQIKESNVINELFFEHHVEFDKMMPWWGNSADRTKKLKDSYKMFLDLRNYDGIRAHSWP